VLEPTIPSYWPRFEARLRHKGATYEIAVENPHRVCKGIAELTLDGKPVEGHVIELTPGGGTHKIRAVMGEPKVVELETQVDAAQ
jgi:cellobiose phosphorylase